MTDDLSGAMQYYYKICAILDQIITTQREAINSAVEAVEQTINQGGAVYLFGTGHSHMLVEEGHYRAGGLAPVIPILVSSLMLHECAINSGKYERIPGMAATILSHYHPTAKDVLFVFSNSGVNAVPVEMALVAKSIGMKVIGVLAVAYAGMAPLSAVGKRLDEVVDIVLDNQIPPGDAVVAIGENGLRCAPASTIAGAFILNSVLCEVVYRLNASGKEVPVYISSNMPGATEFNQTLLEREKARNPHL